VLATKVPHGLVLPLIVEFTRGDHRKRVTTQAAVRDLPGDDGDRLSQVSMEMRWATGGFEAIQNLLPAFLARKAAQNRRLVRDRRDSEAALSQGLVETDRLRDLPTREVGVRRQNGAKRRPERDTDLGDGRGQVAEQGREVDRRLVARHEEGFSKKTVISVRRDRCPEPFTVPYPSAAPQEARLPRRFGCSAANRPRGACKGGDVLRRSRINGSRRCIPLSALKRRAFPVFPFPVQEEIQS
jgi:hypothetical protein